MEQIYCGLAIVSYGIFIIRFILSWVGGDFELDSDADLDVSDVVSFKGLTHFLMGFSGWMSLKGIFSSIQWYDYIISIVIGLIFVVILYYVYKLMCKLENKPHPLSGKELIGNPAKVYLYCGEESSHKYIITTDNGVGTIELNAVSDKKFDVGDIVTITHYNGFLYIINNY